MRSCLVLTFTESPTGSVFVAEFCSAGIKADLASGQH